jgi:hypothetical protein
MKRTDAPRITASMRTALDLLSLDRLDVVHAGTKTFELAPKIRAVAAADVLSALKPLRRD